ncbi:unnamed protein product [Linum tenue]|uniref:DUF4283 domain-containing protein n=4 Tax=Linum tenue TaxID=586396 RepID=A0AAV0P9R6_9ROSI|nr:unnamed protein product [Linum tenue]
MYQRPWRSALVVKLLGRSTSYTVLWNRLNVMWAKTGGIQVTNARNGFYLVRFTSGNDFERALTGGPWMIGDHYLTVHLWDKDFDRYSTQISTTLVWARLLDLPIYYFHKEAVMRIGRRIGKLLRVDKATEEVARGEYARVCMQVDLTKPLLSMFKIDRKKYFIQYEGLEKLCLQCGVYNERALCHCSTKEPMDESEKSHGADAHEQTEPESTYGAWMIAKKKKKPEKRGVTQAGKLGGDGMKNQMESEAGNIGNNTYSFAALEVESGGVTSPPKEIFVAEATEHIKAQGSSDRTELDDPRPITNANPHKTIKKGERGGPNKTSKPNVGLTKEKTNEGNNRAGQKQQGDGSTCNPRARDTGTEPLNNSLQAKVGPRPRNEKAQAVGTKGGVDSKGAGSLSPSGNR